jgi:hypothetical protein
MKKGLIYLIIVLILIIAAISVDVFFMYNTNVPSENNGNPASGQTGGNIVSVQNFTFSPSTFVHVGCLKLLTIISESLVKFVFSFFLLFLQ